MTHQSILPTHPMQTVSDYLHRAQSEFVARRRARAVYNRTLAELSGMTNRELADIGVARSQIEDIASQAAAR